MTSPAMTGPITGIELCVFDAYGTLYDFNSAVARHRAVVGPRADALSEMWRSKQIQYTWLRNSMGAYAPFWQVTGEALDKYVLPYGGGYFFALPGAAPGDYLGERLLAT